MDLNKKFDLKVEHSEAKKVTIEDIIECVFGKSVEEVAECFMYQREKEAG